MANAHLYVTFAEGTDTAQVYRRNLSDTAADPIWANKPGLDVRPSMFNFRKRIYIVGTHARMLTYNEFGQIYPSGLYAPNNGPTLAAGTGSSGSLGIAIGYLTFVHKQGNVVLHESNPSAPSESFELQGNGRTWTGILTSSSDTRVTHVRGYLSIDGAIPRFAWERPLGVTTVTENVLTSALGENLPVNPGLDGEPDFDPNARGVPPYTKFAEVYHNSVYYAGDPLHPDRIYKSRIDEPESVNSIDSIDETPSGWLVTPDGEPVTGLRRWSDMLIVTYMTGAYAIQGFDGSDLQIVKISNFYGSVANASLVRVGPNADLWGAGQDGIWMYNGSFHDLTNKDLRDYWRDTYRANPDAYQLECFAAEDRVTETYKIQTPVPADAPAGVLSFKWIGHWMPVLQGNDPWWTFDMRGRQDSIMGNLFAANSSSFFENYTGSCDGLVRKENVDSNGDDDGDTFAKALTIQTKHFFFGDQGGNDAHGHNFTDLDIFLKNENVSVTLSAYAGDDSAAEAATPQWSRTIPAGAVALPRPKVPKTSTAFNGLTGINGKGITLKFTASSPTGISFRGFAIYHTIGEQERLFSS